MSTYRRHITPKGLALIIKRLDRALAPIADRFDALYCIGHSGIIPGAIMAYKLNKQLLTARKVKEPCHSQYPPPTPEGQGRLLIIDDFANTGGTLMRLFAEQPEGTTVIGIVLYDESWDSPLGVPSRLKLATKGPCKVYLDPTR